MISKFSVHKLKVNRSVCSIDYVFCDMIYIKAFSDLIEAERTHANTPNFKFELRDIALKAKWYRLYFLSSNVVRMFK